MNDADYADETGWEGVETAAPWAGWETGWGMLETVRPAPELAPLGKKVGEGEFVSVGYAAGGHPVTGTEYYGTIALVGGGSQVVPSTEAQYKEGIPEGTWGLYAPTVAPAVAPIAGAPVVAPAPMETWWTRHTPWKEELGETPLGEVKERWTGLPTWAKVGIVAPVAPVAPLLAPLLIPAAAGFYGLSKITGEKGLGATMWGLVAPEEKPAIFMVKETPTGTRVYLSTGEVKEFSSEEEAQRFQKEYERQPFLQRQAEEFREKATPAPGHPGEELFTVPWAWAQRPLGGLTHLAQFWLQPMKTAGEKLKETGQVAAGFTGVPAVVTGVTNRDIFEWSAGSQHLSALDRANVFFQGGLQIAILGLAVKSFVPRGAPKGTAEVSIPRSLSNKLGKLAEDYTKAEENVNTVIRESGSTISFEEGAFGKAAFHPEWGPEVQAAYARLQGLEAQIAKVQSEIAKSTKIKGQPLKPGIKYEPFEVYVDRYLSPKDLEALGKPTVTGALGREPIGSLKTYIELQNRIESLKTELVNILERSPEETIAKRQALTLDLNKTRIQLARLETGSKKAIELQNRIESLKTELVNLESSPKTQALTMDLNEARAQLARLQLGSKKATVSSAEAIVKGAFEKTSPLSLPKLSLYPYEAQVARFAPETYAPTPPGWEPLIEFGKRAAGRPLAPFVPKELKGMAVEEFLAQPGWKQKALSDPAKYAEWKKAEAGLQITRDKVNKLIEEGRTQGSRWDAALDERNRAMREVEATRVATAETVTAKPVVTTKLTATRPLVFGEPGTYKPPTPSAEPLIWAVARSAFPGVAPFLQPRVSPGIAPAEVPSPFRQPWIIPQVIPSGVPSVTPGVVTGIAPIVTPFTHPWFAPSPTPEPTPWFAPKPTPEPYVEPTPEPYIPIPIPETIFGPKPGIPEPEPVIPGPKPRIPWFPPILFPGLPELGGGFAGGGGMGGSLKGEVGEWKFGGARLYLGGPERPVLPTRPYGAVKKKKRKGYGGPPSAGRIM